MIDIILDVNIPKKVKRLHSEGKVLHIGDIDTAMDDEEILHLLSKFNSILVTHDRKLAYAASKKHRSLFIKESLSADEIALCLQKNRGLLKTASIFCENGRKCRNC
ncbi:MAG: hypothetical protein D6733_07020 [Methanobacteriota archaeon]|nr:MAG: hypothetical protein D6733_07020 [Euryarchaeota archaeon]